MKRPCSVCGELRAVARKSAESIVCHDCRAIRREQRKPPAVEPHECPCGELITTRAEYCSTACRMKVYNKTPEYRTRNRARQAESYAPRSAIYFVDCEFCGCLATVRSKYATRCRRPECKLAFNAKRMREGGWGVVTSNRRRKRLKDVFVETVRPLDVFERDGWTCGICDGPVDRDVKAPDPMAPSLDHVTPLSLGGEHSYNNTRLAHLGCNIRRGNRVA